MTIALDPVPTTSGYLVVSENWYPDWRARVDGNAVKVLRGDWTPDHGSIPAGARRVELAFRVHPIAVASC
jgi:hypothetical protein